MQAVMQPFYPFYLLINKINSYFLTCAINATCKNINFQLIGLVPFSIFTFENSNVLIQAAQNIRPLKILFVTIIPISLWASFRNFTLRYFIYLILTHIYSHIFNLVHRIWRKINTLKKEGTILETNMKN